MLFGNAQRKPQGLFGGFAPSDRPRMPENPNDAFGQSEQQMIPQMAQNMGQIGEAMAGPKKPGINWLGVLADTLAGAAGREGPYAAQMQAQRQQEAAAQQSQAQREASMQDFREKFDYQRANQPPPKPHYWESNDGSLMSLGPDGKPQVTYKDPTPRMQFMPDGMGGGRFVPVGGEQGGDVEWGPVVNERPGGVSGNAGGGFPVNANSMDRITVQAESAGNPNAVSPKGARGLWQVMPETARAPGFGIKPSNGTQADDSRVGSAYRRAMESRYGGDPAKMWAAYNWGPGNLDKALAAHGSNWLQHAPTETRNYVNRNMRALRGGK